MFIFTPLSTKCEQIIIFQKNIYFMHITKYDIDRPRLIGLFIGESYLLTTGSLYILIMLMLMNSRPTLCYTYEYCFTSLSAQSWQYRDRRKPEAGTIPYSYYEWLQGSFTLHSTIGSTVYAQPRCQISVPTEIRTWYLQVTIQAPVDTSHRGRPFCYTVHNIIMINNK